MSVALILALIELISKLPEIIGVIKEILEKIQVKPVALRPHAIVKLAGLVAKANAEHDTHGFLGAAVPDSRNSQDVVKQFDAFAAELSA